MQIYIKILKPTLKAIMNITQEIAPLMAFFMFVRYLCCIDKPCWQKLGKKNKYYLYNSKES